MNPKYTKRTFYEREQIKGAGHPAWDKGTLFGGVCTIQPSWEDVWQGTGEVSPLVEHQIQVFFLIVDRWTSSLSS